jgi:SAM-dependent methyltransferase
MLIVALALLLLLMGFGVGALLGAPYLPTLKKEAETALDLLDLKPGQTVLDLGSGDGFFLLVAAKRGIHGIGYEINPLLVIWSKILTSRYRKFITIKWANFWHQPLPKVDGMYVFLIQRYMAKLDRKLVDEAPKGLVVASYTFKIPGKRAAIAKGGVNLYRY